MDDAAGNSRTVRHDRRSGLCRYQGRPKRNALHDYEVCKCIRLDSGNSADVYNMEVVIALAFRLDTYPAAALRSWIVRKATTPVRTAPRSSSDTGMES